jgi:hypothetical protein
VEFKLGGGTTLRAITDVIDHGQKQVADRYDFAVARDYDAVSQVEAMDREGLDVAVLFRTSPLHCDETLERNTPTICAKRGTTGSRISAKRIRNG